MSKVPVGWEKIILSDICKKTISYGIVQTGPSVTGGIPCLRVVDLTQPTISLKDVITTSKEINDSYKKTILEKDEIVMALRGVVGLVKLIDENLIGANITRGLARISPRRDKVEPEFLLWALRSPIVRSELLSRVAGSALQEISLGELRKVENLLPPLPEQTKIAQILSTWDKAITTTEQLIGNSQQQKKSLMQSLLTGKKRLPGFEGEWVVQPLGDWIKEYKNKSSTNDQYQVLTSSRNGLVLQSEYFENSRISSRENIGFNIVPEGYVTYRSRSDDGRFTFNINKLGITGLISVYYPVFSFSNGCLEFFINLLSFNESLFESRSVGTSQKVLSINALKLMRFKIPNINEQQKIAAVLTAADNEIELLQKKLAFLKQEKAALMQQLLTGKRRVKVETA